LLVGVVAAGNTEVEGVELAGTEHLLFLLAVGLPTQLLLELVVLVELVLLVRMGQLQFSVQFLLRAVVGVAATTVL
jgi:hypothetical protein